MQKMVITGFRTVRAQPPCLPFTNHPVQTTLRAPRRVRYCQTSVRESPGDGDKTSQKEEPESKTRDDDSMSSLGEGYATRSDEEGFGGIYGGNRYQLDDEDNSSSVQGKDTEFDHNKGSEVKEKEKARNQR